MDCAGSAGLYSGVAGAFGTAPGGGGGSYGGLGDYGSYSYDDYDPTDVPADQARPDSAGTCPAPADTLQCAGAVSNCWSPGQRDTGPQ